MIMYWKTVVSTEWHSCLHRTVLHFITANTEDTTGLLYSVCVTVCVHITYIWPRNDRMLASIACVHDLDLYQSYDDYSRSFLSTVLSLHNYVYIYINLIVIKRIMFDKNRLAVLSLSSVGARARARKQFHSISLCLSLCIPFPLCFLYELLCARARSAELVTRSDNLS